MPVDSGATERSLVDELIPWFDDRTKYYMLLDVLRLM